AEGDDAGDEWLDGLRHEGLQHVALDRQPQSRKTRNTRGAAGDRHPNLVGAKGAAGSFHADDARTFAQEPRHLAILDDVDAEVACGARVTPHHRVVACGATAPLQETAVDWKARILVIEKR